MKQRVYITSDNKLVVETDNGRLQNGETETVVKGEFAISAHDVTTLRVILNDEVLARVKKYTFRGDKWGCTEIFYGRDKSVKALVDKIETLRDNIEALESNIETLRDNIEALESNIETLKAENEELKQQTALQRESLALEAQRLKELSLWDRIFKWNKPNLTNKKQR